MSWTLLTRGHTSVSRRVEMQESMSSTRIPVSMVVLSTRSASEATSRTYKEEYKPGLHCCQHGLSVQARSRTYTTPNGLSGIEASEVCDCDSKRGYPTSDIYLSTAKFSLPARSEPELSYPYRPPPRPSALQDTQLIVDMTQKFPAGYQRSV